MTDKRHMFCKTKGLVFLCGKQKCLKTDGKMQIIISGLKKELPSDLDWPYCIVRFTLIAIKLQVNCN